MSNLASLSISGSELEDLAAGLSEAARRESQRQFYTWFPDEGEFRRALYPKHLELFSAGARFRERCFMAANRIGKTIAGSYEVTCHLTGLYPDFWDGKRFDRPISAWAAGKTNKTTRDIIQRKLLGGIDNSGPKKRCDGTGMIPGDLLGGFTWEQGITDFVDTVKVKHVSGEWSDLGMKSYQQGSGSFEGTEKEVIWLDEECPEDVYGECLIRTATTGGIILLTFTPLLGMSDVVLSFLPQEFQPE